VDDSADSDDEGEEGEEKQDHQDTKWFDGYHADSEEGSDTEEFEGYEKGKSVESNGVEEYSPEVEEGDRPPQAPRKAHMDYSPDEVSSAGEQSPEDLVQQAELRELKERTPVKEIVRQRRDNSVENASFESLVQETEDEHHEPAVVQQDSEQGKYTVDYLLPLNC
jgi:hypothetical protein